MPSRNTVKSFIEDGYYHVYNRGVDKRIIFLNQYDCERFLFYLKTYLTPQEDLLLQSQSNPGLLRFVSKSLHTEVDLLSFSLMPNHFHLLLKQHTEDGITKLMKRLITAYVRYFNTKYERKGPLFESIYKACNVESDSYLLHLSRYIHLNPIKVSSEIDFRNYSSLAYFLGGKYANWIQTQDILQYFQSVSRDLAVISYKSFIENYAQDPKEILGSLVLEEE